MRGNINPLLGQYLSSKIAQWLTSVRIAEFRLFSCSEPQNFARISTESWALVISHWQLLTVLYQLKCFKLH
jgi:hypothetical protein